VLPNPLGVGKEKADVDINWSAWLPMRIERV